MRQTAPNSESRLQERRQWLRGATGAMALSLLARSNPATADEPSPPCTKGHFKHSVCYWCFEKLGLERLAVEAAAMGIQSIEVVPPDQWPILKQHGLICAMTLSHSFLEGWCHTENHATCARKITEAIDATSAAGFPAVITFSGLRKGMPDDVGLENTVAGLKTVISGCDPRDRGNRFHRVRSSGIPAPARPAAVAS